MMAGFGMGFWPFGLLLWGAFILFGIWVVKMILDRDRQQSSPNTSPSNQALEILEQRYARGEISRDEYEQIRQDLI